MTSDEIQDLKQFIEATISQQLTLQTSEIVAHLKRHDQQFDNIDRRFEEIDEKLDEIMTAVGESLHHQDVRLNDHDDRLRKLERKAA